MASSTPGPISDQQPWQKSSPTAGLSAISIARRKPSKSRMIRALPPSVGPGGSPVDPEDGDLGRAHVPDGRLVVLDLLVPPRQAEHDLVVEGRRHVLDR